ATTGQQSLQQRARILTACWRLFQKTARELAADAAAPCSFTVRYRSHGSPAKIIWRFRALSLPVRRASACAVFPFLPARLDQFSKTVLPDLQTRVCCLPGLS